MKAAVCVPWRAGKPQREEAWRRVSGNGFPWPMVTGDSDPERPFNRSAARNAAARAAGDVDVLIFNDADHALAYTQVAAAVQLADEKVRAVHPYTVLIIEDLETGEQHRAKWDWSVTSGNIVVPKRLFDLAGGWDERFDKWGHEDIAFAKMMTLLSGRIMYVAGPAIGFDHERADDERFDNVPEPPLMARYKAMRSFEDAVLMAQEVKAARG